VDDFYSLKLGELVNDVVEKTFFGAIDQRGAPAIAYLSAYDRISDELNDAYRTGLNYMGAQYFRTPQGLDWIAYHSAARNHNEALIAMREIFQRYTAMWMEGVWEIVRAENSTTKFIVSDQPVTFFNLGIFPAEETYPGGHDFTKIGTRTIFPLSAEACLIITHLQLVRNPWHQPLEIRTNARAFGRTVAHLTSIQFGRQLQEQEVLRINHILKSRATKFIAADNERDLYPEKYLDATDWAKLDHDWPRWTSENRPYVDTSKGLPHFWWKVDLSF
jgi:hypothetical protein